MANSSKISFGTRVTMNTMHNLSKFYSKTKSPKLRVVTHYTILGIFFVSILWKHKSDKIGNKSSEIKFIFFELLSWIHK
ncbi:MAG: hypothetical protein AMQ22_01358 [Candidatus Methanofastidiosum methylothiophilum]|uniref:Uncharacterized protein n=1 Tax=Candidatus Methanofastidiosum methylothiophilum TaxID=1705564 RepID=A0A150J1L1_9EURY|nr:MAG: hypothetical protein AMQ22_01358 [Candidatus Methanofastidiosum methylthiophilus]